MARRRVSALLAASACVVLTTACRDGDDDAAATLTDPAATTAVVETTEPPATSMPVETTESPPATAVVETTEPPSTSIPVETAEPPKTTAVLVTAPSIVEAPTGWSSVLAGVTASAPPPASACETASAGAIGALELPDFMQLESEWVNWFAAFDAATHSITVIGQGYLRGNLDGTVAGSLDVCTDTWSPLNPEFVHPDANEPAALTALVHDADSNAMIAYTFSGVFVHDTELDQWRHHPVPLDEDGWIEHSVWSAAYHPASGLVLTASDELLAHDIDTDEWMTMAPLPFNPEGFDFLGVDTDLDRLVFGRSLPPETWLTDPVSGETMVLQTPELPYVDVVWPNEAFGPADGTIFVTNRAQGTVCGLDSTDLAWTRCVTTAEPESRDRPGPGWAIVGDPINDRLIAVSATPRTWPMPQP